MSESNEANKHFLHIPFNDSNSFHSTYEGKVLTRLLINLCWWLHDMYKIDSADLDAKFQYIEQKINHCQQLFPAEFTLMLSDPRFSPNEQHPLLICRQEEQKMIILVFRSTVSSKSIQDVFTDASIYSNHQVYLGNRHAGFTQRMETAPLLAVTNWLRRGWKVIITGHSLGGAVSQLFTASVISKLVEAGVSSDMVSLRCVTFGTPQCADYHFWSSYEEWYDVFDTYIYEHDAIFRLATFGAAVVKEITDSFSEYLRRMAINLFASIFGDSDIDKSNILVTAIGQICDISRDALIPVYSIFGRHHFICKDEQGQYRIDSIGELKNEKQQLLQNLVEGRCWYDFFIEKKFIPEQFKFIYREFMEHGCYPFCINQLFNREINIRLDKKRSIKQKILRIEVNNTRVTNNQFSDISAMVNFPDEINLFYIYFQGFLTDFITSVKLPIELSESEQSREKKPVLPFDQPDECTVLCFKSNASIEFLRTHSWFEVKVRTYFGFFNVQVVVLSNFNSIKPSIYQLDPIQVVFLAYCEFILDANSTEQIDSPLSHCFSSMFAAFKNIGQNKFDTLMARYWAEAQVRNSYFDIIKYVQNCPMPETAEEIEIFLKNLISLKNMANDDNMDPEIRQNTSFLRQALAREVHNHYESLLYVEDEVPEEEPKLIALHLHIIEIRKYLHRLHTDYNVSTVQQNLKVVMAPFFYVLIKLKRLDSVERYTLEDKLVQTIQSTPSKLMEFLREPSTRDAWILATVAELMLALKTTRLPKVVGVSTLINCLSAVIEAYCSLGDYRNVLKSLRHIAISLLTSTGESVNENANEWELLIRVAQCDWSRELSQARSPDERDAIWTRIFKKKPLKDICSEHRGNFVSVAELCRQLYKMRQILAQQSPKVVIVGQSQTGKSTLFAYLTERNLEELRNIINFNTRMSLQRSAFIKLDEKTNDDVIDGGSALQINIIDSPGYDDATGQADVLLNMSLNAANLVILMTKLDDMNRMGTIKLLDKILHSTQVKVLVLINQVDVSLKDAWEKFRKPNSDKYEDSDKDDSDKDELNEEFSRCETLNTLLQRPTEELIQGLTVDKIVLKSRVTFQPIILKGFNEFNKTFKEPNFRDKVHKSNVNKWIKKNLINSAN